MRAMQASGGAALTESDGGADALIERLTTYFSVLNFHDGRQEQAVELSHLVLPQVARVNPANGGVDVASLRPRRERLCEELVREQLGSLPECTAAMPGNRI